jgi:acyl dehydratase
VDQFPAYLANHAAPGASLPPVASRFTVDMFGAGGVKTIHNDQEAAEREGLAAPIAVGPQVAALIFRMMRSAFGEGWIKGGRCSLTFRRPTPVNVFAVARGVLKSRTTDPDGKIRLEFDVWVETADGEKTVVGTASGVVPAPHRES